MASPQEAELAIEQSRVLAQFKKLHTLLFKHQISHALLSHSTLGPNLEHDVFAESRQLF
jgi:hypothetical protein